MQANASVQINAYATNMQRLWWADFLDAELMARERRTSEARRTDDANTRPAPRYLPDQPRRPHG